MQDNLAAIQLRQAYENQGTRAWLAACARRFARLCSLALIFGLCWLGVGLTEAQAQASIKLFGSTEIKGPLKNVPTWVDAMQRNDAKPLLVPGAILNSATSWDALKARLEGQPPMEQLKIVNTFWNQWPYRLDQEVWGKPDYWASPDEFRQKSGDCEDYAIAKYYTLRALGWKAEDLRIMVGILTMRNIAHAVLAATLDGDAYILDNLSNSILSHTRYLSYVPNFSVNELYRYAHIMPKQ